MIAVSVLGWLSLLLVAGKLFRLSVPLLQRFYLPASILAGLLGLLLFSLFPGVISPEQLGVIRGIPNFLINVVFACIFLGHKGSSGDEGLSGTVFPQITMGQLLGWGQYVIGIGLAGFLFVPYFGCHPAFGNILPLGFQGGHGTVSGVTEAFIRYGWIDGIEFAFASATVGILVGIIGGMVLINWAQYKGIVRSVKTFGERDIWERRGTYAADNRPEYGFQTVRADSVSSMAWHVAWIGLAIAVGWLMLSVLQKLEVLLLPNVSIRLFEAFPLCSLCMLGGVIVNWLLRLVHLHWLIDEAQIKQIGGAALDILVISSICSIRLTVVGKCVIPILLMSLAGAAWSLLMLVWVAPRLFKTAWFEKGIAEFGQSTGVTATGLMLLRTVDPDNRTDAAASFGYKQLFHEPIMGSGIWTAISLSLVFQSCWFGVWVFSAVVLVIWCVIAVFICRKVARSRNR